MSSSPVRRWRLTLPLVALVSLACAAAALAAATHRSASSTLVVDNSFTVKTSDPQRAFDRCPVEEPPLLRLSGRRGAACWLQAEGTPPKPLPNLAGAQNVE